MSAALRAAYAGATALAVSLFASGCRPVQCGARNEPCCAGECLGTMTCVSDVCRAPCAGPLAACDAVTGTGCPVGSTCRSMLSDSTVYPACTMGALGLALADAPCASRDDCAAGLLCYRGRCRFLCCDRDADCANPRQFCVPSAEGFGFCDGDDDCDVFDGSGCFGSLLCYAIPLEGVGHTPTCATPGTAGYLDPCSTYLDCAPGLWCVRLESGDRCLPMCDGAHRCATSTCTGLVVDPGFGVCAP